MESDASLYDQALDKLEQEIVDHAGLLEKKQLNSDSPLSQLLQRAIDLDDEELATRCYLLLSQYQYQIVQDHLKALEYAKLALTQSEDIPSLFWRIKVLLNAANCFHVIRNYPQEHQYLQQCLQLLETDACKTQEYYSLHDQVNYSVGVMYTQMGLHGISQPFIEKALSYARLMNHRANQRRTKLTLANLMLYRGKLDEALAQYYELVEEFKDVEENEQTAILNNYIGFVHIEKGKYDVAEPYIRNAVRIREVLGNELRCSYSYSTLCRLLYLMGKNEEADLYFDKLNKVIEKYPYSFDKQVRNDIYYTIFAAKGDYKKAYDHFRELDIAFLDQEVLEHTFESVFKIEHEKQLRTREEADYIKRMNDEMRQHAKQLEVLNKDLKNYARTASHDLREPLRMVSAYMSILSTKIRDRLTDDEKKLLEFAVDGSKRMDEMITRILNAAKGEKITYRPVDLQKVLAQVKDNLTKLIAEKKTNIHVGSLPVVLGDDIQMMQVFQNLITNAIKYNTSDGPTVHISAEGGVGYVLINVADNGVGIPEHQRDKVFEMFSRVENESGEDGTGIGLSTVKSIIEKMKGKIWIEGNTPNGSIFKIQLPTFTS